MGIPPSRILGFTGPAAWIFDLTILNAVHSEFPRRPVGGVAEAVKRGRDLRLGLEKRRRLYIG